MTIPERRFGANYKVFHNRNKCRKKPFISFNLNGLSILCRLMSKGFQRKERDSNPRKLALQRFSRPPRSTTPASFLIGCKLFAKIEYFPVTRTELSKKLTFLCNIRKTTGRGNYFHNNSSHYSLNLSTA